MDFYEIMLQQKLAGGSGGGEDTGEVWFTSNTYADDQGMRQFTLSNVGDVNHAEELFENADNYEVYLNGEKLQYAFTMDASKMWANGQDEQTATRYIAVDKSPELIPPPDYFYDSGAIFIDASTAPTSVEVSVKAK